ncbi:MAG: DUF523 domain-containing protein, partial [Acholeplasmatales bacterium]|nr:DUF523 domain-containing protein [Acholeplasmatales bacterium]
MEKLLISSCLIGNNTKYNGKNNYIKEIEQLKLKYELIPICPEVLGGLSIPRDPSEINNDKVISINGKDVTKEFNIGANKALNIALLNNIKYALLKDGSPSCGNTYIYDGTFSNKKIDGIGITTKLLKENNITIYNENNLSKLLKKG